MLFIKNFKIYKIHQKNYGVPFLLTAEAKIFCDGILSNPANKNMEFDISPIPLLFNIDEKPCTRVNPKKPHAL